MKGTERLHGLGQSLWLDYISRDLLDSGKLKRYIDEFSVTGLTSNPTIFDQAINNSTSYDAAIRQHSHASSSAEELFFAVALEDICRAAELFRSVHERTNRVDGWVSLELSPLLAHDSAHSASAAMDLFERAGLPNLFIKIPGTKEGLGAIEESIFAGVPVNVTLLFSREQYLAAADAYIARHRAAHRSRFKCRGRVRCFRFHQQMGCGRREQGFSTTARPARHCHGQAHLHHIQQRHKFRPLASSI